VRPFAVLTWRRHCWVSNVTGADASQPACPLLTAKTRHSHSSEPTTSPVGMASGLSNTAVRKSPYPLTWCQPTSHVRTGASASAHQLRTRKARSTVVLKVIGSAHSAAGASRTAGLPGRHPPAYGAAGTL